MVKVNFRLNEQGRKAALLAGHTATQHQCVVINHGEPDYERAVELSDVTPSGTAELSASHVGQENVAELFTEWDHRPTVIELLDDYDRVLQRKANIDAEKREALVQEWLAKPAEEWLSACYDMPCRGYAQYHRWFPDDPRLDAISSEANALSIRLSAESKVRRDQEDAERKQKYADGEAARVANIEKLKAWAVQHGSELLKARIASGFSFDALARKEFALSVVSGFVLARDGDCESEESRDTPTLEEIRCFEKIKVAVGDRGTCELRRRNYDIGDDGDYENHYEWVTECDVTVTCPDGTDKEVYLVCE